MRRIDLSAYPSPARRRLLQQMAIGFAGGLSGLLQHVLAAEPVIEQGVRRVRGTVLVNGSPAPVGTLVPPGATVVTEAGAEAAYVVGGDAFLQRAGTHAVVGDSATSVLRVISGAVLSVFGRGPSRTLRGPLVTAGIRGTGCYLQTEARRTYFCLCYGAVDLTPDGGQRRSYTTKHHDSPFWIRADGTVARAEVSNHEDSELTLLESLAGRTVPFSTPYKR